MSIEKKSLISTLKTTKKATVASAPAKPEMPKSNLEMTKAHGFTKAHGLTKAKGLTKSRGLTKSKGFKAIY